MAFREEDCRVRKDHGAENFAVIRQIALNLLKQEKTAKVGIKTMRLMVGWDDRYLGKVLAAEIEQLLARLPWKLDFIIGINSKSC